MEVLPPLSPSERQYEDIRYSPDDFNPTMEISLEDFKKFFVLDAQSLLEDYGSDNLRLRRYLRHEALHPDQMIDAIYKKMRQLMGKQMLTWGDFAEFRNNYTSDWDKRYGYVRETTTDSPASSVPSA